MATLTVWGLDDELVRKLRIRAAEHSRSAEAERREILSQALDGAPQPSQDEIIERLTAFEEMAGRSAGTVAELLAESRRDRMRQLTGSDDGL